MVDHGDHSCSSDDFGPRFCSLAGEAAARPGCALAGERARVVEARQLGAEAPKLFSGHLTVAKSVRSRGPAPEGLIDGTDVLNWPGRSGDLAVLKTVVEGLNGQGYRPAVILDAASGEHLRADGSLATLMGLPSGQVWVAPEGESRGRFLLEIAKVRKAAIPSREGFEDWKDRYPEVVQPGRIFKGGLKSGALWLDYGQAV